MCKRRRQRCTPLFRIRYSGPTPGETVSRDFRYGVNGESRAHEDTISDTAPYTSDLFPVLLHACIYSHQVFNSNVGLAPGQSWMVIPIHIYPLTMQKCLPFIMYCEVCCQVNCLQTCECMNAYWAIKVYMFVKFHKGA